MWGYLCKSGAFRIKPQLILKNYEMCTWNTQHRENVAGLFCAANSTTILIVLIFWMKPGCMVSVTINQSLFVLSQINTMLESLKPDLLMLQKL